MRVRTERDYYAILGVPATAGDEEIKRAYRRLALRHHPDRNPGDRRAEERFKEISEAYAILMDPVRRRDYDRLRQARPERGRRPEPGWREEEIFRDLFRDPRTASVFDELAREWARMGFRANDAFLRDVFFRGRAVIVVGPGGVRWVGPFGGWAPAERVEAPAAGSAADATPARPGFGGRLWSRAKEALKRLLPLPDGAARRGDLVYEIGLGADELRRGGRYRVTIQRPGRREELLVRVPAGLRLGTRLRLRGKGEPGVDGVPGDLFLVVRQKS